MSDRCTGHCCREFTIVGRGATPDAIFEDLRARSGSEGALIAAMLIPLRAVEPGAILPDGTICDREPEGGGWVFTCHHYNRTTGDCGIYDARPQMCRDFPYGQPCEHHDVCTWGAGRVGTWPIPEEPETHPQGVHLRVLQPREEALGA